MRAAYLKATTVLLCGISLGGCTSRPYNVWGDARSAGAVVIFDGDTLGTLARVPGRETCKLEGEGPKRYSELKVVWPDGAEVVLPMPGDTIYEYMYVVRDTAPAVFFTK